MPDAPKKTSTERVNAYRKRLGGRTITTHLCGRTTRLLDIFTSVAGGQKEAIVTALMALDLLLEGSNDRERDAARIRFGKLPEHMKKAKAGMSCKQHELLSGPGTPPSKD